MQTDQLETAGFSFDKLPAYGRVLLLQGPVGPFFNRLAGVLEQRGAHVTKVNFNSGDDWFYPRERAIPFSGALDKWPEFLRSLLAEGNYNAIFLFGDCRPIHRPVRDIARASGCEVWVFEEGYFRPHYITLERDGVNAFSSLVDLQPEQLRAGPLLQVRQAAAFPDAFRRTGWQAFTYFLMSWLGTWRYPHYLHHRPNGIREGLRWLRWMFRKVLYSISEAGTIRRVLAADRKNRFFVFPLQVHNDAQLHAHSDSHGIHLCLKTVVKSFARHASADDWLVIKHHPLDRGHTNYTRIIRALDAQLGLRGRVHYVHDVHLPTLFDHCKGVVTVNSTAGLQGLHHNLPIITLGRSFYNKPGLTFQGGLHSFWTTDWKPDHDLYLRFRAWTIANTQINSSFYADDTCGAKPRSPREESPAGASEHYGFETAIPPLVEPG